MVHNSTNSLNIEQTTTYDVGNPGHGVWQAKHGGVVKPVNAISTLPVVLLWSSINNIDINAVTETLMTVG
jgi:hypothetical protein